MVDMEQSRVRADPHRMLHPGSNKTGTAGLSHPQAITVTNVSKCYTAEQLWGRHRKHGPMRAPAARFACVTERTDEVDSSLDIRLELVCQHRPRLPRLYAVEQCQNVTLTLARAHRPRYRRNRRKRDCVSDVMAHRTCFAQQSAECGAMITAAATGPGVYCDTGTQSLNSHAMRGAACDNVLTLLLAVVSGT